MKAVVLLIILLIQFGELSRFATEEQSEECAFSGQAVFSRLGEGKDTKKMGFASGKRKFFVKKACGMEKCL